MNKLFLEGIRTRKLNKISCPHCQSEAIVKYGIYKKEQRYKCKDCGRTFNPNTGTLLNWSHYKEKWGDFIETMGKDMSLREAGEALGISYSALFYWRHKIMKVLNQKSDEKLNGIIEMAKLNLLYLDKYHPQKEEDEDKDYFEGDEPEKRDKVYLTFLYQRNNRLDSFIYSDNTRTMDFICGISNEIDKKSRICLNVNYPFRLPLLYNKIKILDISKRKFCYNAKTAVKLLSGFITWMKKFRGVSSKYLTMYAAFYKTHKVFNNMEYLILTYLSKNYEICNSLASQGDVLI
jgi:transposase-like protein